MRFAKLNNFIWQGYATVDFSSILLKVILVSCVHRYYIQNHAQPSHFCETENLVQVRGQIISKFSYDHYIYLR